MSPMYFSSVMGRIPAPNGTSCSEHKNDNIDDIRKHVQNVQHLMKCPLEKLVVRLRTC